ncbi:uracil phosphoribosyltransferase [Natroniella sulfidigena]|uniref:uracil phosphoribosyltransferase n=1 Tax=Natroniella sulfidigena TaxID=723921 RepID=UPI00200B1100|nr:uracil phosphoribosyltransferase [Natroniella sulfidigena]MCK8816404.1 uracil phosphoribosyltransferase [Natroniella sulfidigena]
MSEVHVIDHPLIQHKLTHLRKEETGAKEFRELTDEIATLMAYEVTRDLPLQEIEIKTPVTETTAQVIAGKKLAVVPILRAGLGMVDGVVDLIPTAKVGHIGLYRDPDTLEPVEYYCKMPTDIGARELIVVDPMLATGGTAEAALQFVKDRGAKKIRFMCLVAAPEGIEKLQAAHPDIDIYTAAVDEKLNDHAYIEPGLGDAGDRLYGTK